MTHSLVRPLEAPRKSSHALPFETDLKRRKREKEGQGKRSKRQKVRNERDVMTEKLEPILCTGHESDHALPFGTDLQKSRKLTGGKEGQGERSKRQRTGTCRLFVSYFSLPTFVFRLFSQFFFLIPLFPPPPHHHHHQ